MFSDAYGTPVSISDMKERGEVFFASTREDEAVDEALREGRHVIITASKAAHRVLERLATTTPEIHRIEEYQIPIRKWEWVEPSTPEERRLLSISGTVSRFAVRLMRNSDLSVMGHYGEGTISLNLSNPFIIMLLRKIKRGLPDSVLEAVLCPITAHEEQHSSSFFHNERFFVAYEKNLQSKIEKVLERWGS